MIRYVKFVSLLTFAVLALASISFAKNQEKPAAVDSGSFGIFVNGQRVATETFNIQQKPDVSIATSEVKGTDGKNTQHSELQLSPSGDLRRYEWKEIAPGKAQAIVEPSEDFLIERITLEPGTKPQEKPYILPASTLVLDDYFFSHREILMWRYLAQVCGNNLASCRPQKAQFGVLIPRQQMSAPMTVEYTGPDSLMIAGQQRTLNRFSLSSEDSVWTVWMDPQTMKLIRILAGNMEVVRD